MKKLSLLAFSAWLLLLSQAVPAQWNWATVVPTYPLSGPSFTGQLAGPVTVDCAAPSYAFTGDLNTGLTATAADTVVICAGGTTGVNVISSGHRALNGYWGTIGSSFPVVINGQTIPRRVGVGTGAILAFSSTTEGDGSADVALSRNAAGVVEINNGVAGTYRDLRVRNIVTADGTSIAPAIIGTTSATAGYHFASGVPSVAVNSALHTQFASGGLQLATDKIVGWGFGASASMARAGDNSIIFGAGSSATTTSRTEINKAVTAIQDNTATAVLTFTVPNAAHSASFKVRIVGSLGAGGAIGANESTQVAEYNVNIARTVGVATVATISAVIGQPAAASVAGAANIATSATLSAMTGAVGATQTFTVNATLARSGGSSNNHTALVQASLLNANVSGVTVQ